MSMTRKDKAIAARNGYQVEDEIEQDGSQRRKYWTERKCLLGTASLSVSGEWHTITGSRINA